MQVVILAGGSGTRLKSVTGDLPKPLVDVCGTPLLGRQLQMIASSQAKSVLVLTGYGAEQIAEYCGDGGQWGLRVRCLAELKARGTAGAVLDALPLLEPRFIVMYGDTVLDVDLDRIERAHAASPVAATLFLHPNDHPQDSDLVEVGADGMVLRFHPYPHPEGLELPNLVNAGLYVVERDTLASVRDLPDKPDFGKHVFSAMLKQGKRIKGYRSPEYIKDAGTPDRIAKVRKDVESGRVGRMSFRAKSPAVFLDRDGVLNLERGHIARSEDLDLLPGVAAAVSRLNRSDYRTAVITNQPVVARGEVSEAGLAKIHARLDMLLGAEGAYVDDLFYCPHHPDGGFAGEVAALKFVCGCRKPGRDLIDQAADKLGIDLDGSWFIGDSTADIELARRCGLRSILLRTGHAGRDGKFGVRPDFVFPNPMRSTSSSWDGRSSMRG
jgi:histidinol-phosphate phosphatase family protein